MSELKKQVAELKSQLTLMMTKKRERKALSRTEPSQREQLKKAETQKPDHAKKECKSLTFDRPVSKPKPWYCFRCGQDGHIVAACEFDANPALVAAKRKEFKSSLN